MWNSPFKKAFIVTVVLLALGFSAAARALSVFPVARTGDDEAFPAVSGGVVLWQFYNSRYGDWDIAGADISDPAVPLGFAVADLPGDDLYPVVDGNDAVWQHEYRPGEDWDIYAADLSDRQAIAPYPVSATADDEQLPYVAGGVVVWQHLFSGAFDWDILGARLTGEADPNWFFVAAGIDVQELYPCISGSLVLWHRKTAEVPQPYVYGADISDPNNPRTFYTTLELGDHEIPSLSDGWVVWRETDDVGRVMVDNLYDPFNAEAISRSGLTACPRVHKHIAVWQDRSNGTWDIRAYNLATRQELTVTDLEMSDQVNPCVYVDTERDRAVIVWQDNRDGNWDIYAAILDGSDLAGQPGP